LGVYGRSHRIGIDPSFAHIEQYRQRPFNVTLRRQELHRPQSSVEIVRACIQQKIADVKCIFMALPGRKCRSESTEERVVALGCLGQDRRTFGLVCQSAYDLTSAQQITPFWTLQQALVSHRSATARAQRRGLWRWRAPIDRKRYQGIG
jgi:hypothetical protein